MVNGTSFALRLIKGWLIKNWLTKGWGLLKAGDTLRWYTDRTIEPFSASNDLR
jgi:hypothetical protein